jgi:RHS repeat-associated protein
MPETNFFWDPLADNILQERDENGVVTAEYTTEPGLYGNVISQNRGGVESQFHFDAIGSTVAVTDTNQQVTATRAYTGFGEVADSTGETDFPFQFIGQQGYYRHDGGICIVRRRALHPKNCRWKSSEPTQGNSGDYVYALNRPPIVIDPSGLAPLEVDTIWKHCFGCGGHSVRWNYRIPAPKAPGRYIVVQHIKIRHIRSWCRPLIVPCSGLTKCVHDYTESCEASIYEFLKYIEVKADGNRLKHAVSSFDDWDNDTPAGREDFCDLEGFIVISADVRAFTYTREKDPYSGGATDMWIKPAKEGDPIKLECGVMGKVVRSRWYLDVSPYLESQPTWWGTFAFQANVGLNHVIQCCNRRRAILGLTAHGNSVETNTQCATSFTPPPGFRDRKRD